MSQPPTGTVTFLFTDIEGSTRLWEQHPEAMRLALARHDQLLRQKIEDSDGYVFKTVGDAFCAAFATAPDALAGALDAQQAMESEVWPEEIRLRVRMALHTGAAEERGGDYFGQPLNRVARLLAAGHGGQTLLSLATQELVRDALPPLVTLLELGSRRLKDLSRPETIFQLQHPALAAEFAPLRSLDNPNLPNNLPQQTTSFIGRSQEIIEVKALLAETRLLTLTGGGGSGKTRLSLQAAADLLDGEGDGVWLVELAALSDPALVPHAVADVLGVAEEAGKMVQQSLVEWLKPKRLLIVLDNCEHVLSACASLVTEMLINCPHVRILTSSREPLGVSGERVYRVPSLSLPDLKKTQTVESLSQYEAVGLFIERARTAQPSFAVTDTNAPAVAAVCHRLDGIPLAIELAAARVRSLSVEEVNARLDNRFRLLTGGSRTALPRQQTLRALIDWSYDLLTEQEKTVLCRLSVFVGGWTLSAAEGVCSSEDIEDFEVLDLLTGLVDKSLVAAETEAASTRYRLLETVRQYGADRLAESGGETSIRRRHAAWFLALGEQAEPQLRGPEQGVWLSRLETEHDNLRAVLTWCEQQPMEGGESGLRLAGALWRFWKMRGHFSEGRQWLSRVLERTMGMETLSSEAAGARAKALNGAGTLALDQSEYGLARASFEESLALFRQLGDEQGIAQSLNNLGAVAFEHGEYASARALFEESLTLRRRLKDQQTIAVLLANLGIIAEYEGNHSAARTLFEESLTLRRQLGDQRGIAFSLQNLGNMALAQKDYGLAQASFEESLTLSRQLGDPQGIAYSLQNLGEVACRQSDYDTAQVLYGESLTLFRQIGDQYGIACDLEEIARVAQGRNQPQRVVQLLGAAEALRGAIGSPLTPAEREEIDMWLPAARAALGSDAFAAAWDAGNTMTLDQAVEYAQKVE